LGIHYGSDPIESEDVFGFMPVYHDDRHTPEIESANPGDTISFEINGLNTISDPIVI